MRRPVSAFSLFPFLFTLPACAPALAPTPAPAPPLTSSPAPTPPSTPPSALASSAPDPAPPSSPAPLDPRTARLVRLCGIWGDVRYFHPAVVGGSVDWDAALVAVLPKALAAQTDDNEAAAVRTMLDALHDPATRVDREADSGSRTGPKRTAPPARTVDGVRIIPLVASEWSDVGKAGADLAKELSTSKLAVIDLRAPSRGEGGFAQTALLNVTSILASHEATSLEARMAEHRGYRPQEGVTSGGYQSLFATELPSAYPATKKPHPSHVVFLTNTLAGVPDVAWAMQRTGDASVVVQGALSPDEFAGLETRSLGGGYVAHLRRTELTGAEPRPDVVLDAAAPEEKVIAAAVRAAQQSAVAKAHDRPIAERHVAWRLDAPYADEAYPSRERRLLALFRFWNVIRFFYPYLPLMGDAWDQAFADFLPRFEAAANAHEYALAVAELAARIPDGHVNTWGSKEFRAIRGYAVAPFDVRVIEGKVVVTSLRGDPTLAPAGIAVGDVVEAADGEPMTARMAHLEKYVSASNDSWRAYREAHLALQGAEGPGLKVLLRRADGTAKEVTVSRSTNWSVPERTGPVYRLLDDAIGYVDLDRLENSDVDAMFAALEKTRAIVFDMRGYPHGTAWSIAPRLNVKHAKVMAQFFEPLVSPGSSELSYFGQGIASTDKPLYRGKTVMLVDERTMSQAEHTGLFFEACAGTTFVGSQTAGANGDVTNLVLPGAIYVSFSGHDVRHADGRQLQRVGLVPDIEVHPTMAGIRAGRDEVLERALAYLRGAK